MSYFTRSPDIVNKNGGEAYDGNIELFLKNSEIIMRKILVSLPDLIIIYLDFGNSKKIDDQRSKLIPLQ